MSLTRQPTKNGQSFWEQLAVPRHAMSLLIFYCLLNFILRLALTPNALPGEAADMLFGQSLQWGYRPLHPPLMTWLSWAVLQASGQDHVAFNLLREAVLAVGLVGYFMAARIVTGDVRLASFAAFGLVTTFAFGWLAHLDAPENVLLMAVLALYLWACANVLRRGSRRDYIVLGIAAGAGVLSSYVFLILPVAAFAAVAATADFRKRLKPVGLLLALVIAVAIVLPYEVLGQIARTGAAAKDLARSAGILAVHLAGLTLPFVIVFVPLFFDALRTLKAEIEAEQKAWLKFCEVAILAAAGIVIVLLFVLDSKTVKAPLFYPAAMLLPLWLFLRVRIAGWSGRSGKIYALAVLGIALLSIAGRVVVFETQADNCHVCDAWWPMRIYQDALSRAGFFGGTIVAESVDLGGNMRGVFPQSRVLAPPHAPGTFGAPVEGQCLVVWKGNGEEPKALGAYLAALHVRSDKRTIRGNAFARLLRSKSRFAPLSFILLPDGACRY